MSGEQGGDRGFIVIDKRGREEESEQPPREAAPAGDAGRELPRPDFATLLISLGHSALFHLGLVADPSTGKPGERSLPLARQTIDTIEMLEEKTRGNLTPEEARLVEDLLYDLRTRYVEAAKAGR